MERDLQDDGGVRCGDHLPPYKYIRNTSTCGTTSTEHLLNAGRRLQTSQKAGNSTCTWVRQKKKEKNRDKRVRMGPGPLGGSCEGGKISTHWEVPSLVETGGRVGGGGKLQSHGGEGSNRGAGGKVERFLHR